MWFWLIIKLVRAHWPWTIDVTVQLYECSLSGRLPMGVKSFQNGPGLPQWVYFFASQHDVKETHISCVSVIKQATISFLMRVYEPKFYHKCLLGVTHRM